MLYFKHLKQNSALIPLLQIEQESELPYEKRCESSAATSSSRLLPQLLAPFAQHSAGCSHPWKGWSYIKAAPALTNSLWEQLHLKYL